MDLAGFSATLRDQYDTARKTFARRRQLEHRANGASVKPVRSRSERPTRRAQTRWLAPRLPPGVVRAVIEVRITPERGGGFNRLAERISKFDEVESCYLMSGGYDLLVFVNGASLQKVAAFVSEKLSTIEGVLSTATHFMLRSYKEHGFLLGGKVEETERLKVAP